MSEACRLRQGVFGYWIIVHHNVDHLAWTGKRWALHEDGIPRADYQICNFPTEQEAREACREYGLEPQA